MNKQIAIFEQAIQMLATTIGMSEEFCEESDEKDIRKAFVIRHARNIYQLADDLVALEKCDRIGSIYLFSRPALESLFKLAAAVSNPTFAVEKVVGEMVEEKEKLKAWCEQENQSWRSVLDEVIRLSDEYSADLKRRYKVQGGKTWKIWQVANEGKLKSDYVKHYFLGCKHVHSMYGALIERETGQHYVPEAIYGFTSTVANACVLLMVYFQLPMDISDEALSIIEKALKAKEA
jgi:hypothetical protein